MVLLSLGGSTLADLQQALEDYLPVLLGLVKDGKPDFSDYEWFIFHKIIPKNIACVLYLGNQLQHKVQFAWINQEDDLEVVMIPELLADICWILLK